MSATPPRARMLDPEAADLSLMQDRQVAVIGFDVEVSAHALNLRDSGIEVKVGIDPDSRAAGRAEVEGFQVLSVADVVRRSDVVVLSDAAHPPQVAAALLAGLEPEDLVVLTCPEATFVLPPGVDVVMVSPVGGSDRLRQEYQDGRGSPVLVGVHQEATGMAWPLITAYAAAVGSLRAGAIVVDPADLSQASRFAATGLHDAVQQLTEQVFDVIVTAGVPAEVAYLVTVQELQDRMARVADDGWATQYGPGASAQASPVLDEGTSARLTQLWANAARPSGAGEAPSARAASRRDAAATAHPIEQVGKDVRALMSWVR